MGRFDEVYEGWRADPEGFWAAAAEGISWDKRWDKVLDDSSAPFYRWFTGGPIHTASFATVSQRFPAPCPNWVSRRATVSSSTCP